MKTIEIVNGRKVWAVDDVASGCHDCAFVDSDCAVIKCTRSKREDKRNVIFQPYKKTQQEKTFTLSQINEVIEEIIIKGGNIPWNASLRVLQSKLEQL